MVRDFSQITSVAVALFGIVLAANTARAESWQLVDRESGVAAPSVAWQEVENPAAAGVAQPGTWHAVEKINSWPQVGSIQAASEDVVAPDKVESPSNKSLPARQWLSGNGRVPYWNADWKPQISNIVPQAYGPRGVMFSVGVRGIDCTTGANCRDRKGMSYSRYFNEKGDAYIATTLGFGDSSKWLGIEINNMSQGVAFSGKRAGDPFLGGNMTGFSISRNISPDTAIKIGVENMIRWDPKQADLGKNAYGVVSQRFRLNGNNDPEQSLFSNLFITLGLGNGEFRPVDKVIGAQIEAQRDAHCWTWGYIPPGGIDCSAKAKSNALLKGTEYGQFYPIGSVALMLYDSVSLIGEFTGRNLYAGASVQPIRGFGWTITAMAENLLPNSDYGRNIQLGVRNIPSNFVYPPNVIIDTPKFSIQTNLNIKF